MRSYHVRAPGEEEYVPAIHRNVPKYLTPMDAFEMLITKPTAQVRRPPRMNGQRSLSLSEKCAENRRIIAGKTLMSVSWTGNGLTQLAMAYGGTVRRFETGTEYPKPRMIEGRKSEIPYTRANF